MFFETETSEKKPELFKKMMDITFIIKVAYRTDFLLKLISKHLSFQEM
jgi:hypothetical protein